MGIRWAAINSERWASAQAEVILRMQRSTTLASIWPEHRRLPMKSVARRISRLEDRRAVRPLEFLAGWAEARLPRNCRMRHARANCSRGSQLVRGDWCGRRNTAAYENAWPYRSPPLSAPERTYRQVYRCRFTVEPAPLATAAVPLGRPRHGDPHT